MDPLPFLADKICEQALTCLQVGYKQVTNGLGVGYERVTSGL